MDVLTTIKQLCATKGTNISNLEKELGYGNGSLSKAKKIPSDRILDIAKYFNVSMEYIMTGNTDSNVEFITLNDVARLPIYGRIPAGIPKEAIQEVEGFIEVPAYMSEGYIVLKVIGDSMYPKYLDGDVVIIKERPDCESGQDCAVRINDNDVTLKKVIKMEDGLMLQPLNPEYPPQFFSYSDELCPVYILGVVVEIRRKV